MAAAPLRRRRRDRHGRGFRGPLVLVGASGQGRPRPPADRGRRFDDVVLAEVSRLERRLGEDLDGIEFGVADVPELPHGGHLGDVPLAVTLPAAEGGARIVVFRRPVELRASDRAEVAGLVREALAEQVGGLLGHDPEDLSEG